MKSIDQEQLKFAVIAADTAVFALLNGELAIRLIPVTTNPDYAGLSALPGGLIRPEETAEETTTRILREKAHISTSLHIEQFHTFSALNRDSRGRVVAVAFAGLTYDLTPVSDESAYWQPLATLPKKLAYDHDEIISAALSHIRERITTSTIIQYALPEKFTLTELERAFSSILNEEIDRRNFQKKILSLDILEPLDEKRSDGPMRPARLYRFRDKKVTSTNKI